jgi:hypothetical protein
MDKIVAPFTYIYSFFTLVIKIKNSKIPTIVEVQKKCQVNLHYLGKIQHQSLRQMVNNNVKPISETFDIVNN